MIAQQDIRALWPTVFCKATLQKEEKIYVVLFKKKNKYPIPGLFWAGEQLLISDTSDEMKIAVIFKLEVPTYCVYFSSSSVSLF